jgi:prepilin-type N-terminal cleavage/methylation domain-containing protein
MLETQKERVETAHRRKGDGGFTLIELLVVIVILAILAAIVVFAVGGISNKGQASACDTDLKTIQTAEEGYFAGTDATNPGGVYANGTQLHTAGLLTIDPNDTATNPNSLHTVVVNPNGSYFVHGTGVNGCGSDYTSAIPGGTN